MQSWRRSTYRDGLHKSKNCMVNNAMTVMIPSSVAMSANVLDLGFRVYPNALIRCVELCQKDTRLTTQ